MVRNTKDHGNVPINFYLMGTLAPSLFILKTAFYFEIGFSV